MTPRSFSPEVSARAFVEAAQVLQDEGLIMYEILLVGTGPEPVLREAAVTRKGQSWEPGGGEGSGAIEARCRHPGARRESQLEHVDHDLRE